MSKNINPREKAEKKQKIKNVLFKVIHGISYVCTGLFVAVCIVSCATSQRKQANAEIYPSEIQYRIDDTSESSSEISYPIYDDGNQTITLSPYQFNNYTWNNLNDYFDVADESPNVLINECYSENFSWVDLEGEINTGEEDLYYWFTINYHVNIAYFEISFNYNTIDDFNTSNNKFLYQYNGIFHDLDESITFVIYNGYYDDFKSAIQADIQANEQSDDINVSIFGGITQSLTSFIGTLNSGLTAIIGIFWNSTTSNLTPLGILTALVVGVALTYFVFRLIIGLIRLRG